MDNNNNNVNPNPNGYPQQPEQPDYAAQYNQQPQQPEQPDYAAQYNQQQPEQPDYAAQYNQQQPVQPDYNQQYNQQPVQPDYNQQYNQQPVQPDYTQQYNQQPVQPDYTQQYNQQNDYAQQFNQYNQANGTDYSQQPYQPQPMGGGYAPDNGEVLAGPAKVFSIISFVCGIVSMVSCCWGGFLTGIAAIVFSILAKKKFTGKNTFATLGLVFGIIGLVLATIFAIIFGCSAAMNSGRRYY